MTRRKPAARPITIAALATEVRSLSRAGAGQGRLLLGLCGPPGTGKTTTAEGIVDHLGGLPAAVAVPLDGFHLASNLLDVDEAARRGAIDTFDVGSFVTLLQRLRANDEPVVYGPTFNRVLEEPLGSSLAIPATCDTVVVEGNYLLARDDAWARGRACLDEVWYLDTPNEQRLQRLVDRHVTFGKSPDAARTWVRTSDEANTRLIEATAHHADRFYSIV